MPGFRWKMGDYVGGQTAVHQAYKPWLALSLERQPFKQWAIGEHLIQAQDTTDIEISGLGFRPTVLLLIGYRPRNANGGSDAAFGDRSGGMTFGVAGHDTVGPLWDDTATYQPGDVVKHQQVRYVAVSINTTTEPPSADWTFLPITEFTGSSRIRHAFESNDSYWNEDCCYRVAHDFGATEILRLEADFDDDGFTLHQVVNLYDESDYVAWFAAQGDFQVGVITTGDTNIAFDGEPKGAIFLSTKHTAGVTYRNGYWDHMTGFASLGGSQAAIWGGAQPTSWAWTTERWEDDRSIVLCDPAEGVSFAGAEYKVGGRVASWNTGSVTLDWPVFDNSQFRVGYVLVDAPADSGVLETNWETRPGGSQNDFPDGSNWVPTAVRPDVVFMAATNYIFNTSNSNPFDNPRSPGQFQFCGSGGLGWHASPFSDGGFDAYGVHTFGNAVAERGRYANSGTQYMRRYILAGQGCTSNPPAYHQHSVNIIGNPVIAGINYRYAERHAHVKRIHVNPSDRYVP